MLPNRPGNSPSHRIFVVRRLPMMIKMYTKWWWNYICKIDNENNNNHHNWRRMAAHVCYDFWAFHSVRRPQVSVANGIPECRLHRVDGDPSYAIPCSSFQWFDKSKANIDMDCCRARVRCGSRSYCSSRRCSCSTRTPTIRIFCGASNIHRDLSNSPPASRAATCAATSFLCHWWHKCNFGPCICATHTTWLAAIAMFRLWQDLQPFCSHSYRATVSNERSKCRHGPCSIFRGSNKVVFLVKCIAHFVVSVGGVRLANSMGCSWLAQLGPVAMLETENNKKISLNLMQDEWNELLSVHTIRVFRFDSYFIGRAQLNRLLCRHRIWLLGQLLANWGRKYLFWPVKSRISNVDATIYATALFSFDFQRNRLVRRFCRCARICGHFVCRFNWRRVRCRRIWGVFFLRFVNLFFHIRYRSTHAVRDQFDAMVVSMQIHIAVLVLVSQMRYHVLFARLHIIATFTHESVQITIGESIFEEQFGRIFIACGAVIGLI